MSQAAEKLFPAPPKTIGHTSDPVRRKDPDAPHPLDYNPNIDWLLNEAPALLGERSAQASVVASIERGADFTGGISDNGPHHEAAINAIRAVEQARELDAIWKSLPSHHQQVLRARYIRRQHWPTGCVVFLTTELVGVAMLLAEDRKELRQACCSAAKNASARLIKRERERARRAVRDAHGAWNAARRERARKWAEGTS